MFGKPIQCDIFIASMSRLSFVRVLIEMDLLVDLAFSIVIVLLNKAMLVQPMV